MSREMRVQSIWLAMYAACGVPVVVFEPFTRLGVPLLLSIVIGVVVGLVLRLLAEYIVYRAEMRRSTAQFKAAWRRAMNDGKGKPPTVIE